MLHGIDVGEQLLLRNRPGITVETASNDAQNLERSSREQRLFTNNVTDAIDEAGTGMNIVCGPPRTDALEFAVGVVLPRQPPRIKGILAMTVAPWA